jgi:hypothetical protein
VNDPAALGDRKDYRSSRAIDTCRRPLLSATSPPRRPGSGRPRAPPGAIAAGIDETVEDLDHRYIGAVPSSCEP